MLYWDSSAIVASLLNEKIGHQVDHFASQLHAGKIYTAVITPLEVESAIQRRLSERTITLRESEIGRATATEFRKQCFLVVADQNVLDTALHLQKIYGLRPGDAIQLASARMGTNNPATVYFLCLDDKLNRAAKQEGFSVPF